MDDLWDAAVYLGGGMVGMVALFYMLEGILYVHGIREEKEHGIREANTRPRPEGDGGN